MRYAGEFAALGTALCWALASNLFARAGETMGSAILNRLRILCAVVLLGATSWVMHGSPWPTWATPGATGLLALSGLIGFVFGDSFYFKALVILGPGQAAVLLSLAPAITALIGIPVLGEHLGLRAWCGIAITIAGVLWVVTGRRSDVAVHREGSWKVGVLAGVLGSLGQAVGYVISKQALRTGLDPVSATVIRVVAAAIGIGLLTISRRAVRETFTALRDRASVGFMVGGAVFGPFLGVTLSLAAIQRIEAGVAASITACYPILAMLIAAAFGRDRLTARALVGAAVTVAGVVVLFTR
ncbi:MAG: DMT family transporter [Candidatus Eisenbacteria bacterium]|uniref:DMT family transporter n=1 Tax=Eiseniibacteriota bacterium TaxID=2212470 RepID=A0A849SKZ5_UNCEI|nr:DMT family transporter [Candidatus Eisenbacteria bacterium]